MSRFRFKPILWAEDGAVSSPYSPARKTNSGQFRTTDPALPRVDEIFQDSNGNAFIHKMTAEGKHFYEDVAYHDTDTDKRMGRFRARISTSTYGIVDTSGIKAYWRIERDVDILVMTQGTSQGTISVVRVFDTSDEENPEELISFSPSFVDIDTVRAVRLSSGILVIGVGGRSQCEFFKCTPSNNGTYTSEQITNIPADIYSLALVSQEKAVFAGVQTDTSQVAYGVFRIVVFKFDDTGSCSLTGSEQIGTSMPAVKIVVTEGDYTKNTKRGELLCTFLFDTGVGNNYVYFFSYVSIEIGTNFYIYVREVLDGSQGTAYSYLPRLNEFHLLNNMPNQPAAISSFNGEGNFVAFGAEGFLLIGLHSSSYSVANFYPYNAHTASLLENNGVFAILRKHSLYRENYSGTDSHIDELHVLLGNSVTSTSSSNLKEAVLSICEDNISLSEIVDENKAIPVSSGFPGAVTNFSNSTFGVHTSLLFIEYRNPVLEIADIGNNSKDLGRSAKVSVLTALFGIFKNITTSFIDATIGIFEGIKTKTAEVETDLSVGREISTRSIESSNGLTSGGNLKNDICAAGTKFAEEVVTPVTLDYHGFSGTREKIYKIVVPPEDGTPFVLMNFNIRTGQYSATESDPRVVAHGKSIAPIPSLSSTYSVYHFTSFKKFAVLAACENGDDPALVPNTSVYAIFENEYDNLQSVEIDLSAYLFKRESSVSFNLTYDSFVGMASGKIPCVSEDGEESFFDALMLVEANSVHGYTKVHVGEIVRTSNGEIMYREKASVIIRGSWFDTDDFKKCHATYSGGCLAFTFKTGTKFVYIHKVDLWFEGDTLKFKNIQTSGNCDHAYNDLDGSIDIALVDHETVRFLNGASIDDLGNVYTDVVTTRVKSKHYSSPDYYATDTPIFIDSTSRAVTNFGDKQADCYFHNITVSDVNYKNVYVNGFFLDQIPGGRGVALFLSEGKIISVHVSEYATGSSTQDANVTVRILDNLLPNLSGNFSHLQVERSKTGTSEIRDLRLNFGDPKSCSIGRFTSNTILPNMLEYTTGDVSKLFVALNTSSDDDIKINDCIIAKKEGLIFATDGKDWFPIRPTIVVSPTVPEVINVDLDTYSVGPINKGSSTTWPHHEGVFLSRVFDFPKSAFRNKNCIADLTFSFVIAANSTISPKDELIMHFTFGTGVGATSPEVARVRLNSGHQVTFRLVIDLSNYSALPDYIGFGMPEWSEHSSMSFEPDLDYSTAEGTVTRHYSSVSGTIFYKE